MAILGLEELEQLVVACGAGLGMPNDVATTAELYKEDSCFISVLCKTMLTPTKMIKEMVITRVVPFILGAVLLECQEQCKWVGQEGSSCVVSLCRVIAAVTLPYQH